MVEWENNYKKEIKCKHCGKKDRYEILHEKWKQMRSVWAINTPWRIEKLLIVLNISNYSKFPT